VSRDPAIAQDNESLAQQLRELYAEADERLRAQWQRSLSFQDGMFDRFERARRLGFGEGASIYNSALVFGEVQVGRQSWIGPCTLLDGSAAPLIIGEFCSISAGVHLYTHDTVHWALSGGALSKRAGAVSIADRVYIGPQSIVALGVTIGTQSVVAANSFVNRAVASRAIVGGNPARPIGRVVGEGADLTLEFDRTQAAPHD
jgi:carbonic anhydrase/acetyltransferase-like protein (isoleucine patch superfamily)